VGLGSVLGDCSLGVTWEGVGVEGVRGAGDHSLGVT